MFFLIFFKLFILWVKLVFILNLILRVEFFCVIFFYFGIWVLRKKLLLILVVLFFSVYFEIIILEIDIGFYVK